MQPHNWDQDHSDPHEAIDRALVEFKQAEFFPGPQSSAAPVRAKETFPRRTTKKRPKRATRKGSVETIKISLSDLMEPSKGADRDAALDRAEVPRKQADVPQPAAFDGISHTPPAEATVALFDVIPTRKMGLAMQTRVRQSLTVSNRGGSSVSTWSDDTGSEGGRDQNHVDFEEDSEITESSQGGSILRHAEQAPREDRITVSDGDETEDVFLAGTGQLGTETSHLQDHSQQCREIETQALADPVASTILANPIDLADKVVHLERQLAASNNARKGQRTVIQELEEELKRSEQRHSQHIAAEKQRFKDTAEALSRVSVAKDELSILYQHEKRARIPESLIQQKDADIANLTVKLQGLEAMFENQSIEFHNAKASFVEHECKHESGQALVAATQKQNADLVKRIADLERQLKKSEQQEKALTAKLKDAHTMYQRVSKLANDKVTQLDRLESDFDRRLQEVAQQAEMDKGSNLKALQERVQQIESVRQADIRELEERAAKERKMLAASVRKLKASCENRQTEISRLKKELARMESLEEKSTKAVDDLRTALEHVDDLKIELRENERSRKELEKERKQAISTIEALQIESNRLQKELIRLQGSASTSENEIVRLKAALNSSQNANADTQKQLDAELNAAIDEKCALQNALSTKKNELEAVLSKVASSSSETDKLEAMTGQLQSATERVKEMEALVSSLQAEMQKQAEDFERHMQTHQEEAELAKAELITEKAIADQSALEAQQAADALKSESVLQSQTKEAEMQAEMQQLRSSLEDQQLQNETMQRSLSDQQLQKEIMQRSLSEMKENWVRASSRVGELEAAMKGLSGSTSVTQVQGTPTPAPTGASTVQSRRERLKKQGSGSSDDGLIIGNSKSPSTESKEERKKNAVAKIKEAKEQKSGKPARAAGPRGLAALTGATTRKK